MAEPYADSAYYTENFGAPPASTVGRLDNDLKRASRYVRAEVPGVDERIAAGTLDAELVADIVCEMVKTAGGAVQNGPAVTSIQRGAGPYQETTNFATPAGDLYLSKKQRRLLRGGIPRAGNIDLIGHLS